MNRPIIRLYGLVVLLFALLVAFTSRWTIFEAVLAARNQLNARALLEQQRIARGPILAADGTVLARSVRGPEGTYSRTYPAGELFAQAVGYSYPLTSVDRGSSVSATPLLNGQTGTDLQKILDQLQGKKPQGEEVITTLDPAAQRVAISALVNTKERSWRSTRAPGRSRSWPRRPATTLTRSPPQPAMHASRNESKPAGRC